MSSSIRSAESTTATGRPWLVRMIREFAADAAIAETPLRAAIVIGTRSAFAVMLQYYIDFVGAA